MKISLIIPCYNEEKNVSLFYTESEKVFAKSRYEIEYVFINDGSTDSTVKELKKLYERDSARIKVISFSRNFGKEAAIYAGLEHATGDYSCIIDADLQQRPEVALEMADILSEKQGVDCVAAYPEKRREFFVKVLFKNAFYKIINMLSDTKLENNVSDFRMFRQNVKNAILQLPEYHRFSKGIFAWIGFETEYIPYKVMKRENGSSKWSFFKLCKYAVNGISDFSTKPLYISSFLGIFSILGGFVYYVTALILYLLGKGYSAGALICATIFFVGGMILVCLGIIGAYLVKMYFQAKNRPIYIAKEILEKEDK